MVIYKTESSIVGGCHVRDVVMTAVTIPDTPVLPPSRSDLALLECGHFNVGPLCQTCNKASGKRAFIPGVNASLAKGDRV